MKLVAFGHCHVHRPTPNQPHPSFFPPSLHFAINAAKSWTRKWRMHRRRHPKAGRRYSRCRVRCSRRRPRQPGRSLSSTRNRARRLRREPSSTRGFVEVNTKDFRYIPCRVRNMGNAKTGLPMSFFGTALDLLQWAKSLIDEHCRYWHCIKRIAKYF